ncbi:peroxisomal membrane protein 11C isoform X2 [Rhineura floridana]|uniref:peroxisomal membrane protein 11C isoform X2 n=1 Tax=Rhineura floridana TaxID=261503 RepID=UPI002AC7FDA8|nr:peroxisomal membrane protein 11C isoform X2 [Rhineura floridana]
MLTVQTPENGSSPLNGECVLISKHALISADKPERSQYAGPAAFGGADWTGVRLTGSVAMAAGADGLLSGLVSGLETYRGRDLVVRTLCYGCQLAGGALAARSHPTESSLGRSLLAVSAQLSHCRTVLRLFDDLSMLAYSHQYGLGPEGEDQAVRWLSVLSNLADQLYYPCEHVAWAADAKIIRANSSKWWALSTALWGASLLLGIARSLRILSQLRRKRQEGPREDSSHHRDSLQERRVQAKAEVLTIISNLADLSNAVHWLPPGVLWAGKSPPWLVGLMGTISSLIGVYLTYVGGSGGSV